MTARLRDVSVTSVRGLWPTSRQVPTVGLAGFVPHQMGLNKVSHNMSHEEIEKTLAALCGRYTMDVCGSVRIIGANLPDNAVCAILRPLGDGVMRLVYDDDKPHALAHARAMLQQWWESYQVPVAFPDGSVELVHQPSPRLPEGPVSLSMAG